MRRRVGAQRASIVTLILLAAAAFGASGAGAYVVRGPHGRLYGIMLKPGTRSFRGHAIAAAAPRIQYWGGTVMLSSSLHLIFWGPRGSFDPSYTSSIVQWAQGLAADSGKTTNAFSIASMYYKTHPNRWISRNVYFGGAVLDAQPYPQGNCENPQNNNVCLSDDQLQAEIARVIRAEHWPTDRPGNPRNQYLLFTPRNVDSCEDTTQTSCTFTNSSNGFCAYHSAFSMGRNAVVYSNLPYLPSCDSGQAPAGVFGNPDADGTLDSAIHEVMESATEPFAKGANDYGWSTKDSAEVGDLCNSPYSGNNTDYGDPLGGSLNANTAFNEVIGGHRYYTQSIWAPATSVYTAGCAQRAGPTPDFAASTAGLTVSFDGSYSYDLTGTIKTYIWSYGDGSPSDASSGSHAQHVYAAPGVYQVSLIVEDASGAVNASADTQTEVVQ